MGVYLYLCPHSADSEKFGLDKCTGRKFQGIFAQGKLGLDNFAQAKILEGILSWTIHYDVITFQLQCHLLVADYAKSKKSAFGKVQKYAI